MAEVKEISGIPKLVICSQCKCELDEMEGYEFDGEWMCEECLDEQTFICSRCHGRFWNDVNEGNSDTPLCENCFDSSYTRCEYCSAVINYDDAYYEEDDEDRDTLIEPIERPKADRPVMLPPIQINKNTDMPLKKGGLSGYNHAFESACNFSVRCTKRTEYITPEKNFAKYDLKITFISETGLQEKMICNIDEDEYFGGLDFITKRTYGMASFSDSPRAKSILREHICHD